MKKILFLFAFACTLFSLEVAAKEVVVSSYCPMTHVKGIGHGNTYQVAEAKAVRACIAKGGVPACCNKFIRQVQ